jgi:hypothetical protein
MRFKVLFAGEIAFALFFCGPARASIQFSGSGPNPEASNAIASALATFSITGNNLTLILQNTTSPRTAAQGNALTGVVFDIDSATPALSLTGIALTGGSSIWTSEVSSNTSNSLLGSWTNVLGSSPLAEYGVATTGFAGRFHGGSLTLGNASPNYGIVAAGTFDGTKVPFGGSQFPFIQDSLTFTFSGIAGVSESQFSGVKFLFGTDGTGIVPPPPGGPPPGLPEPTSVAVWSLLVGIAAFLSSRRPPSASKS